MEKSKYVDSLVEEIAYRRKSLGMTQAELAEKSGVLQPSIARLEAHKIVPRLDTLINLFEALGLELAVVSHRPAIRFMFDWTCESPLWADDLEVMDELNNPVDLNLLAISEELKTELRELCIEHDGFLNWNDPASGLVGSSAEWKEFSLRAYTAFRKVRDELKDQYNIYLFTTGRDDLV